MQRPLLPCIPGAALLLAASCSAFDPAFGALQLQGAEMESDGGEEGDVSFGRDIRPLMQRAPGDPGHGCKKCHYPSEPEHVGYDLGGLDLSTLGALRRGGTTSGASIVVAGDPDASVLLQKLEGVYPFGGRMPRNGPPYWTPEQIDKVRYWIADGAKGADDE